MILIKLSHISISLHACLDSSPISDPLPPISSLTYLGLVEQPAAAGTREFPLHEDSRYPRPRYSPRICASAIIGSLNHIPKSKAI